MAADDLPRSPRSAVNIYTAMLVLSFIAIAVGCIVLSLDLARYDLSCSRPPTRSRDLAASVSNCASSGSTFPQEPFHVVFMAFMAFMAVMAFMASESTPAASLKPALFGTLE